MLVCFSLTYEKKTSQKMKGGREASMAIDLACVIAWYVHPPICTDTLPSIMPGFFVHDVVDHVNLFGLHVFCVSLPFHSVTVIVSSAVRSSWRTVSPIRLFFKVVLPSSIPNRLNIIFIRRL